MGSFSIILFYLISALQGITFIYVILSWFMSPDEPIRQFLARIIEPIIGPIRQIIPPIGGMDLSIIAFFVLLEILKRLLL